MIYLIKSEDYVKIGYAKDPYKRLRWMQCANPKPLELIAVLEGDYLVEGLLHQQFADNNVRGEWFKIDDILLKSFEDFMLDEPVLGNSSKVSSARYNKNKFEPTVSDEERETRSERAHRLIAEGKIGPQFGALGGRPRKTSV
jgi:hypothetical protein